MIEFLAPVWYLKRSFSEICWQTLRGLWVQKDELK